MNKILYTASSFGHLAAFHQPYLRWFAEQGYEVHAAAAGEPIELKGVARSIQLPFKKNMTAPENLYATRMLADELRREQYALISTHTSLAAFFTRLAVRRADKGSTAVINTVHGYLFDDATSLLRKKILLSAEKITARQTDYVLTMNRQDTVLAEQHHLGRIVLETPGMGVDYARFSQPDDVQRREARRAFGFTQDDIVLVYAAEFSKRKNQRFLIEALTALPSQIKLLLPGRGTLLEACSLLAERLGQSERVVFPGFLTDMQAGYHAADVCVSASRIEGLPFNLMEAMYCGLPVVASAVKGHEDLIENGRNGFLYPYGDANAWRSCVLQLVPSGMRAKLGEAAQSSVKPYGLETVFPVLTSIYQKVLEQK